VVVWWGSGKKTHLVMTGGIFRWGNPAMCSYVPVWLNFLDQTSVGNDTVILYLQIYLDATHVTTFGSVKFWSIVLWVGNVPKADRNDRGGRGRAILIGFLPTVSLSGRLDTV
jgi:hypothetical protein